MKIICGIQYWFPWVDIAELWKCREKKSMHGTTWCGKSMIDESHLPLSEQSLVFRLRKRAEIRRNNTNRKSVQEGAPDRISDLLEEAASEIERLTKD
jgi:hypothetical protein